MQGEEGPDLEGRAVMQSPTQLARARVVGPAMVPWWAGYLDPFLIQSDSMIRERKDFTTKTFVADRAELMFLSRDNISTAPGKQPEKR